MKKLWIDLETYSSVDLPKTGVYRYAASPDFLILMAGWSTDGVNRKMAIGTDEIRAIPGLRDPKVTKVAHNAQFERICLSAFLGLPVGMYLPPEEFHDTQALAGELGWPQSLEKLALALGAEEKDSAGTRLINIFCKPNRKGERTLPEDKPEEWLDFIMYCDQDVATLIDIDSKLGEWPPGELAVFMADQHINDTGIAIDIELAQAAMEASEANHLGQRARVIELTGVDNPGSQPQMMAWINGTTMEAKNLRAETVQGLLDGDLTDHHREVLELRQELALVASKKYASALAAETGGRLRGTLKFFGAHTGRWTGRGTQVQNLPRLAFSNVVDEYLSIEEIKAGEGASAEDLKRLVRALFTGPFTVVDYAAIEARVIAWLAGEEWALQAFRDGRDIYVETAERMGGLSRAQGKIAVLALGYNGGINSLKAMGGSDIFYNEKAKRFVVTVGGKLEGEDAKEFSRITDAQLKRMVDIWRQTNPNITRLWQQLGDAFNDLGSVGEHLRLTESQDTLGRAVHLWLPSGRAIAYHGVKWEKYSATDPHSGHTVRKEGWRYADPRNPFNAKQRIGTYGGRLAENATQAVARDILAEALVRLDSRGYKVVGHVHDEILVEGEHDVEEITKIMTEVPSWATGMPIDGAGFTCQRYRKG